MRSGAVAAVLSVDRFSSRCARCFTRPQKVTLAGATVLYCRTGRLLPAYLATVALHRSDPGASTNKDHATFILPDV